MKIIYAIVSSDDGNRVTDVLNEHRFSVTRLATTGGFLKKGNATLMIGTDAERVDEAIKLIQETCGKRQRITCDMPAPGIGSSATGYMMMPVTVEMGGATIFVTDVGAGCEKIMTDRRGETTSSGTGKENKRREQDRIWQAVRERAACSVSILLYQ